MGTKEEKRIKLAEVARLYYLEDWKQSDIATKLGVSRPFVSRLLKEARELGVVEIIIHQPLSNELQPLTRLGQHYGIRGGMLVGDEGDSNLTNLHLSRGAIGLIQELKTKRLGLGWGHLMGEMVQMLEEGDALRSHVTSVCSMIGNAGIPMRHYQSSESVRVFAEKLGATPHFFNLPALPSDCDERDLFCSTEQYRQITRQWKQMDTALVNIGNYPSTPDFASGARYGARLQKQRACGRIICYYVNRAGTVIQSDQDFALQIPLDILRTCTNVVGLCSANTNAAALEGALHTGLFTHLVARKKLVEELL